MWNAECTRGGEGSKVSDADDRGQPALEWVVGKPGMGRFSRDVRHRGNPMPEGQGKGVPGGGHGRGRDLRQDVKEWGRSASGLQWCEGGGEQWEVRLEGEALVSERSLWVEKFLLQSLGHWGKKCSSAINRALVAAP